MNEQNIIKAGMYCLAGLALESILSGIGVPMCIHFSAYAAATNLGLLAGVLGGLSLLGLLMLAQEVD